MDILGCFQFSAFTMMLYTNFLVLITKNFSGNKSSCGVAMLLINIYNFSKNYCML